MVRMGFCICKNKGSCETKGGGMRRGNEG